MGDSANNISSLIHRIEQLEQEREELRKDIEQLCMQQAGTGYIGIITRIQAQRTAGLEQEIETLKQKLVACTRDNHTLQEELSEVYRIKSQFADLYKSELEKNSEAEKQIKFFQSRVAAAFSDRDRALMEVERAHEKEKAMSDKLNELQNRIEEITADHLEEAKLCCELQCNLGESKAEIAKLEQVVEKFYQIRQAAVGVLDKETDEDQAVCLLQDPAYMWSFSKTEDYRTQMVAMQEELTSSRDFVEKLHKRLEETRASEDHLMQCVNTLEAKLKHSENIKKNEIDRLRIFQVQKRNDIFNLLEDERKWLESMAADIEAHVKQHAMDRLVDLDSLKLNEERQSMILEQSESVMLNENTKHAEEKVSDIMHIGSEEQWNTDDDRKALAQALQEKVEALLLLSQQEERHLLEKNTNAALEEKTRELQQKLSQVTNEKVAALMELAQLRQQYQQLEEHRRQITPVSKQQLSSKSGSMAVVNDNKDWRVKHLLKRTYLKHWLRGIDIPGIKANTRFDGDDSSSTASKSNDAMDYARMRVENASLQESMANIEHLTTSIHRLRHSLFKAKEDAFKSSATEAALEVIDGIVNEAQHIKTALGSSLPVSWSADSTSDIPDSSESEIAADGTEDHTISGLDCVSSAGLELVELLILASELQKTEIMCMPKQAAILENSLGEFPS
ncbi:uncharacterized protein LOC131066247 isoform X1 [Cryptomeria japonica]|uniref:uncharacterized protein LOC131066247 isoform X1 n=2 Tax=Cryptomeria japonica TaxID=3369 RepID=UPI0025AC9DD8|nr:uncharacterized protein LOC131066247 isoform X1 [Cryptomeria japonica]XP_057856945.1 uncharacterized protein LOC131066247 isoform X1 [Cryptomeria japonica]